MPTRYRRQLGSTVWQLGNTNSSQSCYPWLSVTLCNRILQNQLTFVPYFASPTLSTPCQTHGYPEIYHGGTYERPDRGETDKIPCIASPMEHLHSALLCVLGTFSSVVASRPPTRTVAEAIKLRIDQPTGSSQIHIVSHCSNGDAVRYRIILCEEPCNDLTDVDISQISRLAIQPTE